MTFDQIVVSGGNFLTTVVCARLLTTTGFGVFSVAWLSILFASSVMMAIIVFPMMTAFPGQSEESAKRYIDGSIGVFLIGSGVLMATGILVSLALYLMQQSFAASVVIAGTIATVAIHLQELLRRILILRASFKRLIFSEVCTYGGRIVLLLAALLLLKNRDAALALWALAGAAIVGAIVAFPRTARPSIRRTVHVWKQNRPSVKWLLPAGLMQWTTVNSFLIAASFFSPISIIGQLRAAQNIATLTNPIVQLLENIVPVVAARKKAEGGRDALLAYTTKVIIAASLPILLITPILIKYGGDIMEMLYGNQYAGLSQVLAVMWLLQLMVILTVPVRAGLRAIGNTKAWFSAYLASSIVSLPAALILSSTTAVLIAIGMLLSNFVIISISSISLFKGAEVNV